MATTRSRADLPDNTELVGFLDEIADLLELKGESRYRVNAYRSAARGLETQSEDLVALWSAGRLQEIHGVGASIAAKLDEHIRTGRSAYLEQLRREIPPAVRELLLVPGLGAARAMDIHNTLGISTVAELEAAAREHRLLAVPGIREKTEDKILREIMRLRQRTQRMLLGVALPAAEEVARLLRTNPLVRRVEPAGSIRRMRETIGDIDLVASSERPGDLTAAFSRLPIVKEIIGSGPTKSSILTKDNLQIDLRVVPLEVYGAALQHFTGGKAHNIALREIAIKQGYKLNEYGLFEESTGERVAWEEEADIYRKLGLEWMPPELRENRGELEAAANGTLPDLVRQEDIHGDLQMHSRWSDGVATVREMAEACMRLGYQYAAITDHSQSLRIAGGLTVEQLMEKLREVERVNAEVAPFRVLAAAEVDIKNDGSLDYPDEALERLDLVVAAIHSGFKQSREQITGRIVRALRNPYVGVLAHPSGRVLMRRDPYEVDVEEVIRVASSEGVALEINAFPDRLDLDDVWARRAVELGAVLAINSDAHRPAELEYMRYGVAVARRGWVQEKDVLNALSLQALLERVNSRRPRRSHRRAA